MEPTKLLPNAVARLMRCDSPPESVAELLFKVKYPKPTSSKKESLCVISGKMRLVITRSAADNFSFLNQACMVVIGINTQS